MPNKKNGLKKKNMMNSYMGGGGTMMPNAPVSSMYRMGGKLYMGGGNTKTDNTMSYKDDVQKRFGGGGMTDQPAMKKKNMRAGGPIMPTGPRSEPGMPPRGPRNPMFTKPKRLVRPDPKLPRGKKGKGDI
jgi:hypothetical protein